MPSKSFKGAPFGSQKTRFDVAGIHPKLKIPGTYTEFPYSSKVLTESNRRGPGSYLIDLSSFGERALNEKCSGPGWERALLTEQQAKVPHMLFRKEWEEKQLQKTKLGPGTYDIKQFLDDLDRKPTSIYGICNTKNKRFKDMSTCVPGPGTYKPKPTTQEEKEKTSFGCVGIIDARTPREIAKCNNNPAPGTYNLTSEVNALLSKVVSQRGPYDLFTGVRSYPLTTGHWALGRRSNLGPGQYEMKNPMEKLNHPHKIKHGKFAKIDRWPDPPTERIFWSTDSTYPKNPTFPGPGAYNPRYPSKPVTKPVASFWTATKRNDKRSQKAFLQNYNMVAPDRYDFQRWEDNQFRNGHQSVFNSKTGPWSDSMFKVIQERLRPRSTGTAPPPLDCHNSYAVHRALTIM